MESIVKKFHYDGMRVLSSYSQVYADGVSSLRRINAYFIIRSYGWAAVMDPNCGAIDSRAKFISELMESIMYECFSNTFLTKNFDQMLTFENRLTELSYQELLEYKKTIYNEDNNQYCSNIL